MVGLGYKCLIEKQVYHIDHAGLSRFTDVGPIGTDYRATLLGDADFYFAAGECEKNGGHREAGKG